MNFYASPEYLESVAEVSCKGKPWRIEDVRVDGQVLRLLVVGKKRLLTKVRFLDYYIPLQDSESKSAAPRNGYAESVARGVVELSELAGAAKGFELAPYIDWSRFQTYNDYKAFVLSRNRGLVRERERERRGGRLAETFGKPVFRIHDELNDVLPLAQQWKGQLLFQTGSENWIIDPQVTELLNVLRHKGLLVCPTLRVPGRVCAVWIGFIYQGCRSGWIFTHDPQLAKYSVGHHLGNAMLEESYKLKHREFDFSEGAEEYKMIYAAHVRLLGPIGHKPLSERLKVRAKEVVKRSVPKLTEFAKYLKKEMNEERTPQPSGLLLS